MAAQASAAVGRRLPRTPALAVAARTRSNDRPFPSPVLRPLHGGAGFAGTGRGLMREHHGESQLRTGGKYRCSPGLGRRDLGRRAPDESTKQHCPSASARCRPSAFANASFSVHKVEGRAGSSGFSSDSISSRFGRRSRPYRPGPGNRAAPATPRRCRPRLPGPRRVLQIRGCARGFWSDRLRSGRVVQRAAGCPSRAGDASCAWLPTGPGPRGSSFEGSNRLAASGAASHTSAEVRVDRRDIN